MALDGSYSKVSCGKLRAVIENNHEVASFVSEHAKSFSYLKEYLDTELFADSKKLHLSSLEMQISNTIRERVKDSSLIDYYDCFEILDNIWQGIISDLEIVREQGFEAAREIDEIKVLKKNSKSKKLEEKVVGYDGRLIPFTMIQQLYFKDLSDNAEKLRNELSYLTAEKDELLESIDPNDKAELLKDDDSGDINSKKLKTKITEIKNILKRGAEFDDGSYESIILNVNNLNNKISRVKAKLKDITVKLNNETENKIKALTDEDIHCLLVKKWIDPICEGIANLPRSLFDRLESQINELCLKYQTTFTELDSQIAASELSLSQMIDGLTGENYDLLGLSQFEKLLGDSAE